MLNILSYLGMDLQSEVCLWTVIGLLRTIFDATLFKVNANLKQVWQMSMPVGLSVSVQRIIRIIISGVMLVQGFTLYVYLAFYIVLLYPVFLEERPVLVLPWLLLAAVRQLLCELTCLALGLGICLLLGASRPPCIQFVLTKVISIIPSLYMWMIILNYYDALKVAGVFKTFTANIPSSNHDYGLELAIRRRRTKSLFNEDLLRQNIISHLYHHTSHPSDATVSPLGLSNIIQSTESLESIKNFKTIPLPSIISTNRESSEMGTFEDAFGNEIIVPRDADRILEQFVYMLLRVSTYLKTEGGDAYMIYVPAPSAINRSNYLNCSTVLSNDEAETPPNVGSTRETTASYITDYPQIFKKKANDSLQLVNDNKCESDSKTNTVQANYRSIQITPEKEVSIDIEKTVSYRKISNKKHSNKQSEKKIPKNKSGKKTDKNNDKKADK